MCIKSHLILTVQIFHILFFFFRATSAAYGDSQARGRIGAEATGLSHSLSNTGPKPYLRPTLQLMATPDP